MELCFANAAEPVTIHLTKIKIRRIVDLKLQLL
jgi:hypothetical protein